MPTTTILHEIDVDIVRINPRDSRRGSPQYVFAVHPLNAGVRWSSRIPSAVRSTFIGSTLRPVEEIEISVVHEVARTYSQCRRLYKDLKKLTNRAKRSACRCCCDEETEVEASDECENDRELRRPRCPGEALFSLLDAFLFPRKRLIHRRSRCVFQERIFALTLFIKSVLQKLQSLHELGRHSDATTRAPRMLNVGEDSQEPIDAGHMRCKVLTALLRFLALEDDTVTTKLREVSQRLFGKLNLEGWHSDRKHLYFINEDSPETDHQQQESHDDVEENSSNTNVISNRTRAVITSSSNSTRSVVDDSEASPTGSCLDIEGKKELSM